jgi:hypothetical protein
MAFKVRGNQKSINDLLPILNNSKIQVTNNPLYQTIQGLINVGSKYFSTNDEAIATIQADIAELQSVTASQSINPFMLMGA